MEQVGAAPPPPPPPPPEGTMQLLVPSDPTPGSIGFVLGSFQSTAREPLLLSAIGAQPGDKVRVYYRAKHLNQAENRFDIYRSADPANTERWEMVNEVGTDQGDLNQFFDRVEILVGADPDASAFVSWQNTPTDPALVWWQWSERGWEIVVVDTSGGGS